MAKFKVGDIVRWDFGGGPLEVLAVDQNGKDYLCRSQNGSEVVYSEDKLIPVKTNSRACNSTNPVVRKAVNACGTPKNSAYTDFGLFKDYKTYAATELTAFLQKFGEVAEELKKQATISKRGTNKRSEQEYIDTCLARCQAALKEARDRIQRQTQNVMQ